MSLPGHPANRLLGEARAGRSESLGSLLELYREYLRVLARAQLNPRLQARASPSDLVQETFLQACRHFEQFRGSTEKEWLAWLRRILVHSLAQLVERQVLTQKRDISRNVTTGQGQRTSNSSSGAAEPALISPGSSPSAQAQRRELAALVADQLARLPADYREVLMLRNIESLPFEEVARRMGRTSGAVRILWLRALGQLREMHAGEGQA
ncbi:MAG TPA: sigma-70 family RNA polymerase sigma factor [Gemmataceae bacterium]|nr:sigma-70 family RNA polymerase sigma factor [Gemmataceae bacterium]